VKPAAPAHRAELGAAWIVTRSCGVCGLEEELALDAEGDLESTLGVALKVREDIDRVRRDRILEGA